MLNLSFNYFYLLLMALLFNACKTHCVLEKMNTDFLKEYNTVFK